MSNDCTKSKYWYFYYTAHDVLPLIILRHSAAIKKTEKITDLYAHFKQMLHDLHLCN